MEKIFFDWEKGEKSDMLVAIMRSTLDNSKNENVEWLWTTDYVILSKV